MPKPKAVYAWAWEFDGWLSYWTGETREELMADVKPFHEAVPVRVAILPVGEYRRLCAEAKAKKQ